jgi:hypothetical protein
MTSVNGLRETVDIARKAEERRKEKKLQRIKDAREEIFYKLSDIYLNEIHGGIKRSTENGKTIQHMNHSREDLKVKCKELGTPAEIFRQWLNEVKNPDSKFILKGDDGNKICLDGVEAYVWNNRKFTTEYTWGESRASCPHYGVPCNCFRLKKNDLGFKVKPHYDNEYDLYNVVGKCRSRIDKIEI